MDDLEILEKYIEEQTSLLKKVEEPIVEEIKVEKKKKEKVEEEPKKINKKDKLNERINILNSTNKFNVLPDIDINKEELEILKKILRNENKIDYISLCKVIDLKPSKLDKSLEKLSNKALITNENDTVILTDLGKSFAEKDKDKSNRTKKFQKFIEVLTDDEFNEFVEIVKLLKSTIK